MSRAFSRGRLVRLLAIVILFAAWSAPAAAQRVESAQPSGRDGVLQGTVTTQGTIALGGVEVSLRRNTTEVASAVSDGDGKVHFDRLEPGTYSVVVSSQGFDTLTATVMLTAG